MADKANLLGKRKAEDGLKTEPLLRRHKEKETRQGLADSTLKGTAGELSETKADESNLISEKEEEAVEERLDETPEALERKNRQSLHCSKIILDEAPDFVEAVQENYNTSKFFVYAAEIAAPYPFQPK
ncbi:hypothetical protein HID58_000904 [Brassica napus]|uniref:Uncharacterized protein n=1 Tax=Brassica napus TaxID=3708 RepID=A0ABQ8EHV7_BRANA|nr:hypothetical protein HID58_000904 [Brassica napus]